jgi:DNA processing protein
MREAWLRLKLVPRLGSTSIIRLLQALHTPEAIVNASLSMLTPYVSREVAFSIVEPSADLKQRMNAHLVWLDQTDNHLITLADEDYPKGLLDLPDPPALLFGKGRREQLQSCAIAMVGSRHPTEQGARHARDFAKILSQASLAVVSGLAAGIDAAAHEGALLEIGKTIAVVGTGLDIVYPSRNRALAHAIAEEGLLLSELILGSTPKPYHFPARNRLIAALSRGCLVVEAALQSGSLITARQAIEIGREVFAIPGSIHSPLSKGCHHLIKSGAKLVESVEDILAELNLALSPIVIREKRVVENEAHQPLLQQMGYDPVSLDELVLLTKEPVESISAMLLLLEIEGCVTLLSDGRYQRCI